MSDDDRQSLIEKRVEALRAARPFVLDGRGHDSELVLALVDAALASALELNLARRCVRFRTPSVKGAPPILGFIHLATSYLGAGGEGRRRMHMRKAREIPTPSDLREIMRTARSARSPDHTPIPFWIPIAMLIAWLALLFGWLFWLASGGPPS